MLLGILARVTDSLELVRVKQGGDEAASFAPRTRRHGIKCPSLPEKATAWNKNGAALPDFPS